MSLNLAKIDCQNYSQSTESSFKLKFSITVLSIICISGILLATLATAGFFGHTGGIGFIGGIVGGGMGALISAGIILWIVSSTPKGESNIFQRLAREIRNCPKYQTQQMWNEDYNRIGAIPTRDFASLFIHAHLILPHVYLGDYRAYLSVDPEFIQKYPMTDELQNIFDGQPTSQQSEWAKKHLDFEGCANKKIKTVVSVTQFTSKADEGDWSKYQPDLNKLNIERIQIPVDDVDDAWHVIEPRLDEIFERIDLALLGHGNLLVHCVKGASRSAAVIYAYLMSRCRVSLDQAVNYVQSKRHQVELKSNMRKHLEQYQRSLREN